MKIVFANSKFLVFKIACKNETLKNDIRPGIKLFRIFERFFTIQTAFLVLIVVADCKLKYFRAQDDVATPATMAKDDGVLIYAVGVGPESLRIELQQIASQPLDRHMVRVCNC